MRAAQTILDFKTQAVRDIEAGRIKSIIEPRLTITSVARFSVPQ